MSSMLVAWSPIQWGKPHGLMSISCKEMFERWCRSVGVDLFDLLLASARHPWYSLLPKYCATLIYCHSDKVWLREIRLPMSWVVGCLGWFLFYIRCWDWDWGSFASAALCVIACYSLLPYMIHRLFLISNNPTTSLIYCQHYMSTLIHQSQIQLWEILIY